MNNDYVSDVHCYEYVDSKKKTMMMIMLTHIEKKILKIIEKFNYI